MQGDVELMDAGFFFNKGRGMHPEKPLINVIWVEDDKAHGAIETIENIFNPIPEFITIPDRVRLEVIRKYEDELKPYLQ